MLEIHLDENLNIWIVADECAKEFPETTRLLWLVSMARAIYAEPPTLKLEPDETWDKVSVHNRKRFTVLSPGISLDGEVWGYSYSETTTQRKHRRMAEQIINPAEVIREKYDPDNSPLKTLTEPRTSTSEPAGINARAFKEKIHREHFRAWCKFIKHPLPRFWFGSEAEADALATVSTPAPPAPVTGTQEPTTRQTRTDPLKALICRLFLQGVADDKESIWLALLNEQGKPGSCVVSASEAEKGPVIRYRTGSGTFTDLNKEALAARLKRYKKP